MRDDIFDLLCCPACKGGMELTVIKTNRDEIIEGTLVCKKCKNKYFIRNGTAYLVPEGMPPEAAYPVYINRTTDEKPGQ